MSYEQREFLRHILAEADNLVGVSAGLSRAQLEEDPTVQRAVVRSIEIIGEATKRVPTDIRAFCANATLTFCALARRDRARPGKRQKAVMCVTFSASTRSLRTQLLVSCRSVYTR